jgi:ribosomal protein L37E
MMSERCPRCGNTKLVVKKFTVGDNKTTVYDYFCPKCGFGESIKCDEPGWQQALARWRESGESTTSSGS